MRSPFLVFSVMVAISAPAAAQTLAPGQGAASAPTPKEGREKVTCRTFDATGSRLSKKKICRTAAQWAEQNDLDRQDIDRQQANRWKNN